jgi:hypothetical protein
LILDLTITLLMSPVTDLANKNSVSGSALS